MTIIDHTIANLPSLSSAQSSLPFALSQPIKVFGEVHNEHLIEDIIHVLSTDDAYEFDIGVDEVGRGPLYGSVVVSAAILPKRWSAEIEHQPLKDTPLSILTDSKKLTEVKRERLFVPIKQQALAYVVIDIPAAAIDEINILQATMMGMRLACEQLMVQVAHVMQGSQHSQHMTDGKLSFKLLIDGNKIPDLDWALLSEHGLGQQQGCAVTAEAWVKGDGRHTAIAAASVLAKVTRDRQVVQDGLENPGYGLEGHKGYPTKAHIEAINSLGVLPQHRRSFRPVQEALDNQQRAFQH